MSKSNPLVSIIIPCYNYGKYLEECVNSVLDQTYPSIEIIVINDGSTDNTDDVANKLAAKNKRVRYYHQQDNKGIIFTRNRGIDLAKGDFLIQLDADDWLDKNYILKTVDAAINNKADIIYTKARIFGRTEFSTQPPQYNLEYLKHDNYIHASSLVRKSVLVKRRYDEYLDDKGNEDWDIFLDACMDGAKAFLVNEALLNYRKHDDANSRSDIFQDTLKEALVRHHILSKQNAKHPDNMWYFSPYIISLKKLIDQDMDYINMKSQVNNLQTQVMNLQKEIDRKDHYIKTIEKYLPIGLFRKIRRAIKK